MWALNPINLNFALDHLRIEAPLRATKTHIRKKTMRKMLNREGVNLRPERANRVRGRYL